MAKFLKTWLKQLVGYSKEPELETIVSDGEKLTRFVFSKRLIRRQSGTVKPGAFLPAPRDGKTSVFRTSGWDEADIWHVGETVVAAARNESIKARADLPANCVFAENLTVTPATKPHPAHADIGNWPEEKSEQMLIAQKLAEQCSPSLVPGSP